MRAWRFILERRWSQFEQYSNSEHIRAYPLMPLVSRKLHEPRTTTPHACNNDMSHVVVRMFQIWRHTATTVLALVCVVHGYDACTCHIQINSCWHIQLLRVARESYRYLLKDVKQPASLPPPAHPASIIAATTKTHNHDETSSRHWRWRCCYYYYSTVPTALWTIRTWPLGLGLGCGLSRPYQINGNA